jgi:hypothetical protein
LSLLASLYYLLKWCTSPLPTMYRFWSLEHEMHLRKKR